MNFTFTRKRVTGVLTIIPQNEQSFVDDMRNFNFPEARSRKLMEVMGYDKHRMVTAGVCVSDLACFGIQHLFDRGFIDPDDIDALILVTQSPDYFIPPTSNVIQGIMGLKQDMLCLDINQGCAGFVIGLIQSFLLLEQPSIRTVMLVNADVLSRKTSRKDRNSYPLVGDAAAITIIEASDGDEQPIHANLKMDGTHSSALMIPAGGFRTPSTTETAELQDVGDNNFRAKDNLRMDGTAVFNFVQTEVPPMIEDLLSFASTSKDSIDYFITHQPNRFMLQKLADKLQIDHQKMPMNVVERFGNSSGATIPTAMTLNLAERLKSERLKLCLAGFGVGLTWASMLMVAGQFTFCDILEYP